MRGLLAIAALVWALPSLATAQVRPDVSEARQAAFAGNFDQARAGLDGAVARDDLTRDDLIAVFEASVFIDFATGDPAAMRTSLEGIAALDPSHSFDANYFPNDVTDVFDEIVRERTGRLTVTAEAVVLASGEFEVRGSAENDPGGLTRDVRVYGRGAGGEWASDARSVRVDPEGAESGEYYAEAIGPGGAVVAQDGSQGAPLSLDLALGANSSDGGVPVWVWVAGAAGLAAIAVIVIIAVVASSGGVSDDTQPSGPMVRFSM
jgi:hypothetical protein